MMKKLTTILLLIFFFALQVYSMEEIVKKDPKLIKISTTKKVNKEQFKKNLENNKKEYKKEEKNLKDSYYTLYRISDRLIRANNLQSQNWRFAIRNKTEEVNAYAAAANLITLYSSLFDSLYNNDDAMAFIIGHEMSHFIYKDGQRLADLYKKINDNEMYCILAAKSLIGAPYIPVCGVKMARAYKDLRKMEYNADKESLTLMAKAGYDLDGATEAMEYLAQLPHIKHLDDTHPMPDERIKAIKAEIDRLNVEELKNEGEYNLLNSEVLAVKTSYDRSAADKKIMVLLSPENKATIKYTPQTEDIKSLKKAYSAYIKDDIAEAKYYFEEAYKLNKKNYIAPLYLSYISEYEYYKTGNKKSLKKANYWIEKANKINSSEKNVINQKYDIEKLIDASN